MNPAGWTRVRLFCLIMVEGQLFSNRQMLCRGKSFFISEEYLFFLSNLFIFLFYLFTFFEYSFFDDEKKKLSTKEGEMKHEAKCGRTE